MSVDHNIYVSNPQSLSTTVLFLDGSVSRFSYDLDRSGKLSVIILPMKQLSVITHRYTILQERGKNHDTFLIDQHVSMLCFTKIKEVSFFCGHNILTGVFLTQLSNNVGISVSGIVWVIINCCFMSTMRHHPLFLYYYLSFKCSQ